MAWTVGYRSADGSSAERTVPAASTWQAVDQVREAQPGSTILYLKAVERAAEVQAP